jgi:hypothetical protein
MSSVRGSTSTRRSIPLTLSEIFFSTDAFSKIHCEKSNQNALAVHSSKATCRGFVIRAHAPEGGSASG